MITQKPLLVLSAITLLLSGTACGRRRAPEGPTLPSAQVRLADGTAHASSAWLAVTLSATQRAVLATRLAAAVRKVHVNEGQRVAAGALLVSLGDEDLQGGLQAAEAAVATAAAHHRRIETLAGQNAAIPAEMDMAKVQLAQAQAGLAAVQANLSYTRIRAPFAGTVQVRRVNEGDFVGPGMPLVELEGPGMEFTGSVSAAEARGLKIGQRLPFEIDGRSGEAQITALSTGGDPVSHRGVLRARVVQGGDSLRSGAFGRLRLPQGLGGDPGRSVPESALVHRGELTGVFVAREGRAELRWISVGERMGGRIVVRAGLAADEAVVDAPGDLVDGQAIEVLR